jgi:LacI family transcriptional regulator
MAGPKNLLISNRRKDGYAMSLYRHKMKVDEKLIVHCEFSHNSAMKTALKLLKSKDRPDGIFAISDRVAIGAMAAAKKLNLRIPEDVAIIGFNDEPIAALVSPSLSSIRQPAKIIGQMATKLLIDQIESEKVFTPVIKSYMTRISVRESTKKK